MSFRYRVPRRATSRPAEPTLPFGDGTPEATAIPVSLFVAKLNGVLRASLPDTWVKGEIGEWRVWSSGHAYFTLKDASAALAAVMWASDVARVPFRPEEGMEVLARGRPDVYPRSGKLSFVVSRASWSAPAKGSSTRRVRRSSRSSRDGSGSSRRGRGPR